MPGREGQPLQNAHDGADSHDPRYRPPPPRRSHAVVLLEAQARQALRRGADAVADTVRVTLGPKGDNILIARHPRRPLVTNDGVVVARAIELADEFENMGAQLMVEAATGASRVAGDGTTTATVLAQAMLAAGERALAAGANAMMVQRGIERAKAAVVDELTRIARPVENQRDAARVATTASNDSDVGELIGQALWRTRPDGAVTVADGRGLQLELRLIEGIGWDQGYESPGFVNTPYAEVVLEQPRILITDQRLRDPTAMRPFFEMADRAGVRSILVTCHEIADPVVGVFLNNVRRGNWQAAVVRAPAFGRRRREICQDLAIATGGRFVAAELRLDWAEVTPDMLGRADRVVVRANEFVIVGPGGDPAAIQARIAALHADAARLSNPFQAERVRERIRKLRGRAAVLEIGAPSELERDELRPRVQNALASARAAMEGGTLPGGGTALLRARAALDRLELPRDQMAGVQAVRSALSEPVRQIAANARFNGALVVEELLGIESPDVGFDALSGRFEDLRHSGVLDSLVTVRSALVHAASVAGALLTTEAAIRYTPEPQLPPRDEDEAPARPGDQTDKTRVLLGEAGRRALLRGVDALAGVVKTTLGPRGRAVALERRTRAQARRPVITVDGAAVARDVELPDPFENLGAGLLREAAVSTSKTTGDGTTTATVLAQAILHAAGRRIAAGANAMLLRHEIEAAAARVDRALVALARPIESPEEIRRVAQVAAGDAQIAAAVAEAYARVGSDGAVDVQDGRGFNVVTVVRPSMRLDAGYPTRLFVTDTTRGQIELESPRVLITDQDVSSAAALAPLCEQLIAEGSKRLLLLAPRFHGEALRFLLTNTRRGVLQACPVVIPSSGEAQADLLQDIAVWTGGTFLARESGAWLDGATPAMLGRAERSVTTAEFTTLVEGGGSAQAVALRRRQVQAQLGVARPGHRRRRLRRRLRNLAGEVAVLEVGAATELERESTRHLVEDAVRATGAALAEGIVAGGGTAYLHARACLHGPGEQALGAGARIMHEALTAPLRTLLENSGVHPAAILPSLEEWPYGHGYDVVGRRIVNMFDAGVVDPLKVLRASLRNAVSTAIALLTTDAAIARLPPPPPAEFELEPADYAAMLSDDPGRE